MAAEEAYEQPHCSVTGTGGNRQLVNQDEEDMFEQFMSKIATRTEGMQETGRH